MELTDSQQALLNGEQWKGKSMAMQIQAAVGEGFEAARMVSVSKVHVALSAQEADVWFAGKLLKAGASCTVSPTVNPGYSLTYFKKRGWLDDAAIANMEETSRVYKALGATLTYSCTPYLFGNIPNYGEVTAFSETSATIYINSVLGARSNRESAASALCAAITGYVPEYGMLLDENRWGDVLVEVKAKMEKPFDYALLGLMGKKIGRGVPVFTGLPQKIPTESLIALGAQLNVSGTYDMYHIPGVTPEAETLNRAFGGMDPKRRVAITQEDMDEVLGHYSFEMEGKIDYVLLGCPHYTYEQLRWAERLLQNKKAAIPVMILTSSAVQNLAKTTGLEHQLLECGAEIIADTCVDEACCFGRLAGQKGATDSPKGLYYMRTFGVRMAVRNMETCLMWAQEGKVC